MSSKLDAIWFVEPAIFALANRFGTREEGVELHGVATKSSDEQYASLVSEKAHFAITAMDNVMDWNLRDPQYQFRIVAQVEATTPLSLVGRMGFRDLSDLRGGVLLVDAPENGFVVAARSYLEDNGLTFGSYDLSPAGGVRERYDALMQGEGDVTLLGPPFDAMAEKSGAPVLARINDCYPAFPGQGIVVLSRTLDQIEPRLKNLIARMLTVLAKAVQDKDNAVSALIDHGFPAPAAKAMADHLPDTLIPDQRGVELLIAQRRNAGLRGAEVTYADFVDLRLFAPQETSKDN